MAKPYPQYLFPIAVALKWEKKITIDSLASSYGIFVDSIGDINKTITTNPRLPELKILKFLQENYITLPNSVTPGSKAVETFLNNFLIALQKEWKLSSNNKTLMALATRPVSFSEPKKYDGENITEPEIELLKYFAGSKTHALPAKETVWTNDLKKLDTNKFSRDMYSNDLKTYEQSFVGGYLRGFLKSPLVEYKYRGTRDLRDLIVVIIGILIPGLIGNYFLYTNGLIFHENSIPAVSILAPIFMLGVCGFAGFLLTVPINLGISALLKVIFGRQIYDFFGDEAIYLRVKLTPQGENMLEQVKAWENYKTNNPETAYGKY